MPFLCGSELDQIPEHPRNTSGGERTDSRLEYMFGALTTLEKILITE
jgi:hypothetical protein